MEITDVFAEYSHTKRVSDAVYMSLKHMIIKGGLLPGHKLAANAISKELDISVTTVNEAIKMLEYDGYAEFRQNSGYLTAEISLEDVLMLNDLLSLITTAAVEAVNIYDRATLIMIEESLKHKNEEDNFLLDKKFHLTLAQVTGNDELISAMRDAYDKTEWGINALNLAKPSQAILDEHNIISYYLTKHDDKYRLNLPSLIERHRLSHEKIYTAGRKWMR